MQRNCFPMDGGHAYIHVCQAGANNPHLTKAWFVMAWDVRVRQAACLREDTVRSHHLCLQTSVGVNQLYLSQ